MPAPFTKEDEKNFVQAAKAAYIWVGGLVLMATGGSAEISELKEQAEGIGEAMLDVLNPKRKPAKE